MITLTVDTHRLEDLIRGIARELGVAAGDILRNEVSLFTRAVINKTPPDNKKQGEDAIADDLRKVFTPVQQAFIDRIGSEFGLRNIDTWIGRVGKDPKYLHLLWQRLDPNGTGMAAFHQSHRNSRGRVAKGFKENEMGSGRWQAKYVVSEEDFAAYKAKVQARVGLMKSGWVPGLNASDPVRAGKVPNYIRRHGNRVGFAQNHLSEPTKPYVIMGNSAPNIRQTQHFVSQAVRTRQVALSRRLRRAVSGIHDDVAAGRRVSKIQVTNE